MLQEQDEVVQKRKCAQEMFSILQQAIQVSKEVSRLTLLNLYVQEKGYVSTKLKIVSLLNKLLPLLTDTCNTGHDHFGHISSSSSSWILILCMRLIIR